MAYVPGVGTAAKPAKQTADVQTTHGGLRSGPEGITGDVDEAIRARIRTARTAAAQEQSAANFDALQAMVPNTAIPMANVQRVA